MYSHHIPTWLARLWKEWQNRPLNCSCWQLFYRKPLTKARQECLESSAAPAVATIGAVVTHGPTWGNSARLVRSWSTLTTRDPSTGEVYTACYQCTYETQLVPLVLASIGSNRGRVRCPYSSVQGIYDVLVSASISSNGGRFIVPAAQYKVYITPVWAWQL